MSTSRHASLRPHTPPRRSRSHCNRWRPSSSRGEPERLELVEEAGSGAEPLEVGAAAFEQWVDGEAVSFNALDFDDLVDLAGKEALFAVLVGRWAGAVDDDVDLAQPVERLFGGDLRAGGECEAGEVAQAVVGCFAVDAGHTGVAGGEGPKHRHRFGAAALADDDPARVEPERAGDELLEADAGEAVEAVGA